MANESATPPLEPSAKRRRLSPGWQIALGAAFVAILVYSGLLDSLLKVLWYERFFGVHGDPPSMGELLWRAMLLLAAFLLLWLPVRVLLQLVPPLENLRARCPLLLKIGTLVCALFLFLVFLEWAKRRSEEPWSLHLFVSWLWREPQQLLE